MLEITKKEVYSGTFTPSSQVSAATIDVGVNLSDDDIFILVGADVGQATNEYVFNALKTPTMNFTNGTYHGDFEHRSNTVSFSGTTVTAKGAAYYDSNQVYYWYLIKS